MLRLCIPSAATAEVWVGGVYTPLVGVRTICAWDWSSNLAGPKHARSQPDIVTS